MCPKERSTEGKPPVVSAPPALQSMLLASVLQHLKRIAGLGRPPNPSWLISSYQGVKKSTLQTLKLNAFEAAKAQQRNFGGEAWLSRGSQKPQSWPSKEVPKPPPGQVPKRALLKVPGGKFEKRALERGP